MGQWGDRHQMPPLGRFRPQMPCATMCYNVLHTVVRVDSLRASALVALRAAKKNITGAALGLVSLTQEGVVLYCVLSANCTKNTVFADLSRCNTTSQSVAPFGES